MGFFSPPPVSRNYISILDVKNKRVNQTFTRFCRLRPGHMPSQAPHTSLIMQMRGNVTPRQQMARDDNNGSTDQFQCLRLYRYGNNKNRRYEILVLLIWFCPLSNVCTCQSVSFLLDHLNVKALSDVAGRGGFLSREVWLSVKGRDLEMIFGDYGRLLPSSYSTN